MRPRGCSFPSDQSGVVSQPKLKSVQNFTLPPLGLLLVGLISIFWGFNWPIVKFTLTVVPLWTFRSICVVSGAIGLFAIARFSGLRMQVPTGQWPRLLAISAFNITGWNVFAVYGITYLPAGRASIIGYTMPLWGIPLSCWLLGERITARRVMGLVLGMVGMLILIGRELEVLQRVPVGGLLMMGAAVSWAIGTVLMKRFPVDLPTSSLTGWMMLLGGIPIVLGALILEPGQIKPLTLWPTLGLLYNMLISFTFCYWAWFRIVEMVPVGVSSLSSLMVPVIGVFSGMLILGERPHWEDFSALALVLGALATVLIPSGKQTEGKRTS